MLDIAQSPNTPPKTPVGENDWEDSLHYLERELATYRQTATSSATPEEVQSAADRVAAAVARSMGSHPRPDLKDIPPSYQLSTPSQKPSEVELLEHGTIPQPRKLKRGSRAKERDSDEESDTSSVTHENPAKQAGRGLLMLLATPLAIAGMGVYACGMMMEGGGMILKGAGSIGRIPLKNVRKTLKGKKKSNRK